MVVGAGHVGMITAARLADADVFDEIVLAGVVEGLAAIVGDVAARVAAVAPEAVLVVVTNPLGAG